MAQLALAGAGAVIGSVIPGVGTALGWSVGAVLGGMLFPPKQAARSGPRISDLDVTASTYGIGIPRIAGTVRLAGNMIWTAGIREDVATGGGGKGGIGTGKGPRTTTYSYFATFAVGFCAGPAARVLRMWADTKLIYDETGATENVHVPGLVFRFYPGDETQIPDPAIVAAEGEANTPAHRGLAYVVVEDAPLEAFGNRIPSLVAEIATAAGAASVAETGTNIGPSGGLGFGYLGGFAVDWARGRAYRGANTAIGGGGSPVVSTFEIGTLAEMARTNVAIAGGGWPQVLAVADGGALYARAFNGGSCPIYRLDGDTIAITGTLGTVGFVLDPTPTEITAGYAMATAIAYGLDGPVTFVVGDTFRGALYAINGETMGFIWGEAGAGNLAYHGTGTGATQQILAEPPAAETVNVWIVHSRTNTPADVYLYRLEIGWNEAVSFAEAAHLTATTLGIPAGCICEGAAYDGTDGGLILHLRDASSVTRRLVKWTQADGVLWNVATDRGLASAVWAPARIQGQSYGWMVTNDVRVHDARTGALAHSAELAGPIAGIEGGAFDSLSRSIVATAADGLPLRAFLDRGAGQTIALSSVVASICAEGGLAAGDVDVAELVDAVRGYRWEQGAPREHMQPLSSAFSFDAVETGGKIAFRKRGRAPVATIPYAGVARVNNQERNMAPRRDAELELPRRLTVRYRDVDRDQLQGAAHWVRPRFPARLTDARSEVTLDLDLVLSAGEAKAIARRNLAAAYSERTRVDEVPLPPAWLLLDPADVIELQTRDGGTLRVRLDRVDAGADYSLRVGGAIEGPATYSLPGGGADGGRGFPPQSVGVAAATRIAFPDLPLIRDAEDTAGVALRVYLAAAGYSDAWTSASVFWSRDSGASFETLATLTSAMAWGAATTALAAPASPWTWDDTNSLTVAMQSGAARVESATDLQVLNGANAAALVKANGSAEIIQWRDVTVNGNGTLTLSRLLRGRRGTDDACAGHLAGELFVVLEAATWRASSLPLSDRNVSRLYRVAGPLDTFDAQPLVPRSVVGRAEQPYSPVHILGTRDGSDNLSITWTRRTRIGGEWLDGTGTVPLGEGAEAYEVDILAAPAGAVVRAITGLASPAASYLAADQTTDFGSPQASVAVRVFQISAAVGRGVSREAVI